MENNLIIFILFYFFVVVSSIYIYIKLRYRYFQIRKIPHLQPSLFFGSANELCLGRKSLFEFELDVYEKSKPIKLLGLYMFLKPTVYICDVRWIKDILTKDFSYFNDRGVTFDTTSEPLTKNLFHLEGQRWKYLRNKVKPMFVADRIKILFPSLVDSANKLKDYIDQILPEVDDLHVDVILNRYAADVIGSCAFGIESGALRRGETKFYQMSKKIFSPRLKTLIKLILPKLPAFVSEFFDIKMIENKVSEFFTKILREEIEIRRSQNIDDKNDFLNFLMELQRNQRYDCEPEEMFITDELIMAQCFMLFIAGFENTTSVISATLFELARHQDIQKRLFEEISKFCMVDDTFDVTFEKVESITYLDMVLCEILRLYPPNMSLIRECSKDYKIPGTDFVLEKGVQVVIPICGIHYDPQYFPSAAHFDPENFNAEAKASRDKYAYIPFGEGPRTCIGQKLGKTFIKIALVVLIRAYQILPSPKMVLPVKFEKKAFVTKFEGGVWARCQKR